MEGGWIVLVGCLQVHIFAVGRCCVGWVMVRVWWLCGLGKPPLEGVLSCVVGGNV